jgi:hypothetical protein
MKDFKALIEDLRNDEIRSKYGPELALIPPGQWDWLVKWAKTKGYDFTVADVKAHFTPPGAKLEDVAHTLPTGAPWDLKTLLKY